MCNLFSLLKKLWYTKLVLKHEESVKVVRTLSNELKINASTHFGSASNRLLLSSKDFRHQMKILQGPERDMWTTYRDCATVFWVHTQNDNLTDFFDLFGSMKVEIN